MVGVVGIMYIACMIRFVGNDSSLEILRLPQSLNLLVTKGNVGIDAPIAVAPLSGSSIAWIVAIHAIRNAIQAIATASFPIIASSPWMEDVVSEIQKVATAVVVGKSGCRSCDIRDDGSSS